MKQSMPFLSPDGMRKYLDLMKKFYGTHTDTNMGNEDINGSKYYGGVNNFGTEVLVESRKLLMDNPDINSIVNPKSKYSQYFDIQYSDLLNTYDQQNMLCAILKKDSLMFDKYSYSIHLKSAIYCYSQRSKGDGDPRVFKSLFFKSLKTPTLVIHDIENNSDEEIPMNISDDEEWFFSINKATEDFIEDYSSNTKVTHVVFTPTEASDEWEIEHPFGKDVNVVVINDSGQLMEYASLDNSNGKVTITFDTPVTGIASVWLNDPLVSRGICRGFDEPGSSTSVLMIAGYPPIEVKDNNGDEFPHTITYTSTSCSISYPQGGKYYEIDHTTDGCYDDDIIISIDENSVGSPLLWYRLDSLKTLPDIGFTHGLDYAGRDLFRAGMDGNHVYHLYPYTTSANFPPSYRPFPDATEYPNVRWYILAYPTDGKFEEGRKFSTRIDRIQYVNIESLEWDPTVTKIRVVDINYDYSLIDINLSKSSYWNISDDESYAYVGLDTFSNNQNISDTTGMIPAFDIIFDTCFRNPYEMLCNNGYSGFHADNVSYYSYNSIDKTNGFVHKLGEYDGLPAYFHKDMDLTKRHSHIELYAITDDANFKNQSIDNRQTCGIILDTAIPVYEFSDDTSKLNTCIKWQIGPYGYGQFAYTEESVSSTNFLSELVYVDDNTFSTIHNPAHKDNKKFVYHNNSLFSLSMHGLDPELETGRGFLVSNDHPVYENNKDSEWIKPGRTVARICDIPTSFLQIGSVQGVSPSVIIDTKYITQKAPLTAIDIDRLYNTAPPMVTSIVPKVERREYLLGDYDGDGIVDEMDLAGILKIIARIITDIPVDQFYRCDADEDGRITIHDAVKVGCALDGRGIDGEPPLPLTITPTIPKHTKFIYDVNDDLDSMIDLVEDGYTKTENLSGITIDIRNAGYDDTDASVECEIRIEEAGSGYDADDLFKFNICGIFFLGRVVSVSEGGEVTGVEITEPGSDVDACIPIENFDGEETLIQTASVDSAGSGLVLKIFIIDYDSKIPYPSEEAMDGLQLFKFNENGNIDIVKRVGHIWKTIDCIIENDSLINNKSDIHSVITNNMIASVIPDTLYSINKSFIDKRYDESNKSFIMSKQDSIIFTLPEATTDRLKRTYAYTQTDISTSNVYNKTSINICPPKVSESKHKEYAFCKSFSYEFDNKKQPIISSFNADKKYVKVLDTTGSSSGYKKYSNTRTSKLSDIIGSFDIDAAGIGIEIYRSNSNGKMASLPLYNYSPNKHSDSYYAFIQTLENKSVVELLSLISDMFGNDALPVQYSRMGKNYTEDELKHYIMENFFDVDAIYEERQIVDRYEYFEDGNGNPLIDNYNAGYEDCCNTFVKNSVTLIGDTTTNTANQDLCFILRIDNDITEELGIENRIRVFDDAGVDVSKYSIIIMKTNEGFVSYVLNGSMWVRRIIPGGDE